MIKAIITDIDGVIVGDKHGINFPLPNKKVIHRLKELHKSGLPIIFCTGKFSAGVLELIKKTELTNPHITDAGALIIDPLDNLIIRKYTIDKQHVKNIVSKSITNNIYVSVFGIDEWLVQKDQVCELTTKQTAIFQQEPKIVDDLQKHADLIDVIKIIPFARNDGDKLRVESILQDMHETVNHVWSQHPTLLPALVCLTTANGVSKKTAAEEVFSYLKISPEETLGIGDTLGDWKFMKMCKYAATVGNESQELKDLVKTKGEGNYFIGSSVDDNGFLDILDYFIK